MPHGKTLEIIEEDAKQAHRVMRPRETVSRDRSLRGKARTKARKEQNRTSMEVVDG